ncbi:MAG: hypothetical protein JXA20_05135 [Spirochaetes bacterium]|nr:hypothetical protein [Spirochaetota bacterium]
MKGCVVVMAPLCLCLIIGRHRAAGVRECVVSPSRTADRSEGYAIRRGGSA